MLGEQAHQDRKQVVIGKTDDGIVIYENNYSDIIFTNNKKTIP